MTDEDACRLVRRARLGDSDHHMLLGKQTVIVSKRRSREPVAAGHRSLVSLRRRRLRQSRHRRLADRVLDDGTVGLAAIKKCGGVCVQDPDDAEYPDMPKNALNRLKVDHCLPLAEMGALLSTLNRIRAMLMSSNKPSDDAGG